MGKSIFLTGSKGFVGSHLLPKLIEAGYEVETDMRYLEMKKWNCIIHLSATTHIKKEFDPNIYYNNILLTHKILSQPCRVIYASSCSAAHDTNPYAQSKMWAEHLGEKHGNALGLRFHNIYGPGNNKGIVWYLMQQPDGAKITIRGKDLVRDYVYIDQIVETIIRNIEPGDGIDMDKQEKFEKDMGIIYLLHLALDMGIQFATPEIYNYRVVGVIDVGSGTGTSTIELVNLYMKLSGKTFELEFTEAGEHEPLRMVSNNPVPSISLEEGLLKLINEDTNTRPFVHR